MLLNDAAYRFNNTAAFRLMIHSRHTLISDREVVMAQRCNKFQPRLPVFISHAQTRNMHFWMMKAGSAARHESNMDHIKRLFLPLKSGGREGEWSEDSQASADDSKGCSVVLLK